MPPPRSFPFGPQLALTALAGAQLGLAEGLLLARGGVVRGAAPLAEVVGLHALLGLAVGLPVVAGTAALAPAARRGRLAGWLPARRAAVLPVALTLFALLGAIVNIRYLPYVFSPVSLAVTGLLLAAALALGLAWSRRPWGREADRALVAALLVLDLGGFAWGAAAGAGGGGGAGEVRVRPGGRVGPDLFVVLFDTLRADHLGTYGYERPTSPAIDALAAEGTVFERAYSPSNWTRPAVASLFTSTMPSRHDVVTVQRALSPELPQLSTALAGRGYRVGYFTTGTNVEPADGYDRDVDHFYFQRGRRPIAVTVLGKHVLVRLWPRLGRRGAAGAGPDADGGPEDLTREALAWVGAADPGASLFVYLHYAGPHDPYRPPAGYLGPFGGGAPDPRLERPPGARDGREALAPADRERMVRQYDAEIRWHDEAFGELVAGLRAAGRLDDAVVVVTSDHGEAFGEHGLWGHGVGLYEEIVRVPLVFWRSGDDGGARVEVPVGLLDLAPTLAELAGAEAPASFDGGSLVPWLGGAAAAGGAGDGARTVFIENPDTGEAGLRDERWAFWEEETEAGRTSYLYRASDRRQLENLAGELPEVVAEYRALVAERRRLDRERRSAAVGLELDADRIERLRALGYLQ